MPTNTALLLIDLQNDYFPGGKMELCGAEAAVANAAKLLAAARQAGVPVIHIQHISNRPGATFFLPNTPGADIHKSVRPLAGEDVVVKNFPNSFRDTGLLELLRKLEVKQLFIAGMMSHMCVDATTRAAFDLGFECRLAHDACSTRNLSWNGAEVQAAHVHAAFMAALGAVNAKVSTAAELATEL